MNLLPKGFFGLATAGNQWVYHFEGNWSAPTALSGTPKVFFFGGGNKKNVGNAVFGNTMPAGSPDRYSTSATRKGWCKKVPLYSLLPINRFVLQGLQDHCQCLALGVWLLRNLDTLENKSLGPKNKFPSRWSSSPHLWDVQVLSTRTCCRSGRHCLHRMEKAGGCWG